jgi:hypothetical protein
MCKHNFTVNYKGKDLKSDVCRFCGENINKVGSIVKKETINTIKRHLKGIEKAIEELEKE